MLLENTASLQVEGYFEQEISWSIQFLNYTISELTPSLVVPMMGHSKLI
jgi:hypothetical protein